MEAGREMDKQIAIGVMALTVEFTNKAWSMDDWMGSDTPTERNTYAIVNADWKPGASFPHHAVIPTYSTDIEAAMLVITRLAELGYWCEMRTPFERDDKDDYWAGFTPHSTTGWNGCPDHWTQAETLPLAICLAAIAAAHAHGREG